MTVRLAWRSLWRNKRRTIISISSISLGLAFAIFFIALAEGGYEQIVEQAVRIQSGHITLEHPAYLDAPSVDLWILVPDRLKAAIERLPDVESIKPVVMGQGIVKSGAGNVPAAVVGVDPLAEKSSGSPVARNIVEGGYLTDEDNARVVIGSEMAKRLNVSVGKKLVIATNDVNGTLVEELCRIKGIFHTGSSEVDSYFIQMPIPFAQKVFSLPEGGVTMIGLILKHPGAQKRVINRLDELLVGLGVSALPWQEVIPDVATYIKMDRGSNLVFQAILVILVLFTIFNTLSMSVMERQREFAVLMAIGTTPSRLRLQVMAETLFLAAFGSLAGLLIGGAAAAYCHVYGIDLGLIIGESVNISGFALSSKIHAKLSAGILLGSTLAVFLATLALGVIPVMRSARVDMVERLR